jgi:hypothetical protein
VCVRERQSKRGREKERKREKEGEGESERASERERESERARERERNFLTCYLWDARSGAGDYEVSGHQTFTIGFGYNKMLIRNKGVRTVHFPDGGCIAIDFPGDKFTNVFFGGDMIHETTDSQTYTGAFPLQPKRAKDHKT